MEKELLGMRLEVLVMRDEISLRRHLDVIDGVLYTVSALLACQPACVRALSWGSREIGVSIPRQCIFLLSCMIAICMNSLFIVVKVKV